jgi:sterol 24-C-methyltransferase
MVARMTTIGKFFTQNTVWVLEKMGFVPKGTYDVGEALKTAADALVAGGREKLFTPMREFLSFSFFSPLLLVWLSIL